MRCSVCGKGLEHGPLYRQNEKGVEGIWAHAECSQVPLESEDIELAELLHDGANK